MIPFDDVIMWTNVTVGVTEVILKGMGKIDWYHSTSTHNKAPINFIYLEWIVSRWITDMSSSDKKDKLIGIFDTGCKLRYFVWLFFYGLIVNQPHIASICQDDNFYILQIIHLDLDYIISWWNHDMETFCT